LGVPVLLGATVGACALPRGEEVRVLESSLRVDGTVPEGVETRVASWVVPARVELGNRLLQISGRIATADEADLPAEVVVRAEIVSLSTGEVRKRFRAIVDRSPENGFRKAKKFPKGVAGGSLVTVSLEPVGSDLPAGAAIDLCLDVVAKRGDLETFASCAAAGAATTLAGLQAGIFSGRCATSGCHDSATAEQGLVLEAGQSFAHLIDVPATQAPGERRVRPGDPARSYLIRKLRGTNNIGGRMPLGGPFLTDEEIAGVVEWIENGARNE
jgi:hypothetical protein